MSVRTTLSARPAIGIVAGVAFLIAAVSVIVYQLRADRGGFGNPRAFFTVDDGTTWFADAADLVPPFDHQGKPAVQAFVFRCDDGKAFVGYLQRFRPEAKRAIEAARDPKPDGKGRVDPGALRGAYTTGREVKRPGEATWTSAAVPIQALKATTVKCPDGKGDATPVEP